MATKEVIFLLVCLLGSANATFDVDSYGSLESCYSEGVCREERIYCLSDSQCRNDECCNFDGDCKVNCNYVTSAGEIFTSITTTLVFLVTVACCCYFFFCACCHSYAACGAGTAVSAGAPATTITTTTTTQVTQQRIHDMIPAGFNQPLAECIPSPPGGYNEPPPPYSPQPQADPYPPPGDHGQVLFPPPQYQE